MGTMEIAQSKVHFMIEHIEYVSNSVPIKKILQRSTGNMSLMSYDFGNGSRAVTFPFDTFAQIIEGEGEIVVDGKSYLLENGEGMVIPAHRPHYIIPKERFKMNMATIKSGHESV